MKPAASWKDQFTIFADIVMSAGAPYCDTLDACAGTMNKYFEEFITDDVTNTYITLVWCGAEGGHMPDKDGNVWWYDHYQVIFFGLF